MSRATTLPALVGATVFAAIVVGGCHATVSYRVSHGADMAPAGTDRGQVTSLRIREYGGIVGNLLTYIAALPAPPAGVRTNIRREESTVCGTAVCTTTTTTTSDYVAPTAEEIAAYKERAKAWDATEGRAILSGAFPTELTVDIAMGSLGGDTSGFMASQTVRYPTHGFGPFETSYLSLGIAGGRYVMHDRAQRMLVATAGGVEQQTAPTDTSYVYFGLPLRFTGLLTPTVSAYAQLDMNVISLVNDANDVQIVRTGATWYFLPLFFTTLEISSDRFRTDSFTGTAEVGVGF
jgi:hypothetical protein